MFLQSKFHLKLSVAEIFLMKLQSRVLKLTANPGLYRPLVAVTANDTSKTSKGVNADLRYISIFYGP